MKDKRTAGKGKLAVDKSCSIFMECIDTTNDGMNDTYVYSMRRVCAFIMYLLSGIFGLITIITPIVVAFKTGTAIEFSPWAIVAAIGVPALVGTILLFFTTWEDLSKVADSIHR